MPGRPVDFIPIHISDAKNQVEYPVDVHEPMRDAHGEGENHTTETAADPEMRRMTVRKEMLEKYGYTDGCPGCVAVRHTTET